MRSGREAVKLATKACELSKWQDPQVIDTLAAAFAEDGNFQSATAYEERALRMSRSTGEEIEGAQNRISLYLQKQAYRENQ
jgi:hypothetical protein